MSAASAAADRSRTFRGGVHPHESQGEHPRPPHRTDALRRRIRAASLPAHRRSVEGRGRGRRAGPTRPADRRAVGLRIGRSTRSSDGQGHGHRSSSPPQRPDDAGHRDRHRSPRQPTDSRNPSDRPGEPDAEGDGRAGPERRDGGTGRRGIPQPREVSGARGQADAGRGDQRLRVRALSHLRPPADGGETRDRDPRRRDHHGPDRRGAGLHRRRGQQARCHRRPAGGRASLDRGGVAEGQVPAGRREAADRCHLPQGGAGGRAASRHRDPGQQRGHHRGTRRSAGSRRSADRADRHRDRAGGARGPATCWSRSGLRSPP